MDKIKIYLAVLKKHHFWVLLGLVAIVSLVTWSMGTRQVQAKFEENQRRIKGVYTTLLGFQQGKVPNDKYIKALETEEQKIKRQVVKATDVAFKSQQKVLPWPDAVKAIESLHPTDEISPMLRDNYQNLVARPDLERIFEKIRLRKEKPGANPMGGAGRDVKEFTGIVDWKFEDRDRLMKRYTMNSRPSTIQVRVVQEDFWAFESLVDIVLTLNHDATDNGNAVIKRIEMLDLAQWATRHAQEAPGAELQGVELEKRDPSGFGASMGGAEKALVPLPDKASQSGEKTQQDPDLILLDGRYLDADNKPVGAEAALGYFRREGGGAGPTPGTPPFAEFKQMAVLVKILMDQRKLPELMAACANSPLPIEVRQVLMTFTDTDNKQVQDPGAKGDRNPFDAEIEIRGIVYIYNEPDEKRLGTGSAPNPAKRSFGVPVPSTGDAAPMPMPVQEF